MSSNRLMISDAVAAQVAPRLPGKTSDRGVTARDNRLLIEAVLHMAGSHRLRLSVA